MTRVNLLILYLLLANCLVYSQQKTRASVPGEAKGYYKSLQAFSPDAVPGHETVDKQKFPYDPASAEKRLSLKPYYLMNVTPSDFKIPDPPANSSAQTRAELNYLLALQYQRTELDVESSRYMAGVYYKPSIQPHDSLYSRYRQNLFHIGRSIGSWFNPQNLPLTADLMANVWRDASYFIWTYKYKHLRVRPYVLEPDLQNLEETNWAAYPSGHAANSYVNAYIYQELAPEFSEIFLKDAFDMAHSREILGVHYPSDSEAGRVLARQFVDKLFQNEKFTKDFEAVKQEWKAKAKETFIRPAGIKSQSQDSSDCSISKQASSCAKKCE